MFQCEDHLDTLAEREPVRLLNVIAEGAHSKCSNVVPGGQCGQESSTMLCIRFLRQLLGEQRGRPVITLRRLLLHSSDLSQRVVFVRLMIDKAHDHFSSHYLPILMALLGLWIASSVIIACLTSRIALSQLSADLFRARHERWAWRFTGDSQCRVRFESWHMESQCR